LKDTLEDDLESAIANLNLILHHINDEDVHKKEYLLCFARSCLNKAEERMKTMEIEYDKKIVLQKD
jgi:hypothetical protein